MILLKESRVDFKTFLHFLLLGVRLDEVREVVHSRLSTVIDSKFLLLDFALSLHSHVSYSLFVLFLKLL